MHISCPQSYSQVLESEIDTTCTISGTCIYTMYCTLHMYRSTSIKINAIIDRLYTLQCLENLGLSFIGHILVTTPLFSSLGVLTHRLSVCVYNTNSVLYMWQLHGNTHTHINLLGQQPRGS